MTLYEVSCFFLIYAFLGWCLEVVYAAVSRGEFVNRGMLNGPVCPIYGFGFVFVIFCLSPVADNLLLLYVLSALLTTVIELAGGFVLEQAFGIRWWDYTKEPFNLGGYICLKFSLLWGLACCVALRLVHPAIRAAVALIPRAPGIVIVIALYIVLSVDFVETLKTLLGIKARVRRIAEVEREIRAVSDKIGEAISGGAIRLRDADEWATRLRDDLYGRMPHRMRRLMRAFPHMKKKYMGRLEALSEKLRRHLQGTPDAGNKDEHKDEHKEKNDNGGKE